MYKLKLSVVLAAAIIAAPVAAGLSPTHTRLEGARCRELLKMNSLLYRQQQPRLLRRFALGEIDLSDGEMHLIRAAAQAAARARRRSLGTPARPGTPPQGILQLIQVNTADEASAIVAARDFVKQNLLSPRTAKFSGNWFPEERVWQMGPDQVKVFGWVDAQNVFGATVRNYYTCILRKMAEGVSPIEKWILVDINIALQ